VDQKKNLTIKVDQTDLKITQEDAIELPQEPTLDAFRNALELNLSAYLTAYFKDQLSGFYGNILKKLIFVVMYTGDASNWSIYVGVSAKNINLPNF
jgi:capping protein alpha